jgi:hypothetical protein
MPVDPRRAGGGSAEIRGAQRIADLERRLGQLERGSKGAIIASGNAQQTPAGVGQALTTLLTDIAGCSVSITAQVPTIAIVSFTGGVLTSYSTTSQYAIVYLNVDGTDIASPNASLEGAHQTGTIVSSVAASIAQTWRVSLAAGTHTLKFRAKHSAAAAAANIANSSLSYTQTRA